MTDAASTPRTSKNTKNIQKHMPKCIFPSQNALNLHLEALFFHQTAFGAKMGPPPSCVQVIFKRFWVAQEVTKTANIQKKRISKFDVFLECLLEGLLQGFGRQV